MKKNEITEELKNDGQLSQYADIADSFDAIRAVEARYIEPLDEEDRGNTLIQALPPMFSKRGCAEYFFERPCYGFNERNAEIKRRQQAVLRLEQFRAPMPFHYKLALSLHNSLIRSYRAKKRIPTPQEGVIPFANSVENPYVQTGQNKTTGFSVIGIGGGGKTTSITRLLHYYPQVIVHTEKNCRYLQLTYIKVECPPENSMKSFYRHCLHAMEEAVGNIVKFPCSNKNQTKDAMEQKFKKLASRFNLGVIVIDEIQNLINYRKNSIMQEILTLVNDIQVPVICLGTPQAQEFFESEKGAFYYSRRIEERVSVERYKNDTAFKVMMENLWKYQWLREDVPLNQEFVDAFYHESAGIIDRVVSLYEAAQINAIFSETDTKEKFAPEFIGKISKSYFPESSKQLHILADDMLDNSMIVWSDLYRKEQGDWNGLKNSIKPSEDLTDLITNPDFQKEIMDYDVKWNHTIQTVWEFFEDGYSRKEIEKALNSLRLSKRSIIKMEEGVLRKKVIKALMEPEWMKSDDDAESYDDRYELPICTGLE